MTHAPSIAIGRRDLPISGMTLFPMCLTLDQRYVAPSTCPILAEKTEFFITLKL